MNCIERTKPIYTAIAAPGSGKTEKLLSKLPDMLSAGTRLILALPTLVLSDEISERARSKEIRCWPIDHRAGEIVVPSLGKALKDEAYNFIICTQESLRRVEPHLLDNWTLVLDELPKVVDYPNYPLTPVELERVLQYTMERDGQLWIPEDQKEVVREQVTTNRGDANGTMCSTLGRSAAHIFRLLLSEVEVFIDQPMPKGERYVRAVEEFKDWWSIVSSAHETHVLAASITNSEFEVFAQAHGFQFEVSEFTPGWRPASSNITIYPVLPREEKFSKQKMRAMHKDGKRLIDVTLARILEHVKSKPLLFANIWAKLNYTPGVIYVPKDCRGLNGYTDTTEAIVLFGGNPSPADKKGLAYLSKQYSRDFEESFITNRLLEPTLQAVTRTAVRCSNNTCDIKLYVQDYRVVDYLLATYFPDATVDWSLSKEVPLRRDGRKLDQEMEEKIIHLLSLGTSAAEINRQTKVSRKKIQLIKEAQQAA